MNVLMLGDGAASAVTRPLAWMLNAGFSIWLMSHENPYSRRSPAGYQFIRTDGIQPGGLAGADWRQARIMALKALVEQIKPGVVHVHGLGVQAAISAAAGVQPLVFSAWGWLNHLVYDPLFAPEGYVDSLTRASRALVVESPALLRAARSRWPGGPRIELIPMGVDPRRFRPPDQTQRQAWRHNLHIREETFVILSPRGWGRIYNHELILQAFHCALPKFRRPALLAVTRMGRNNRVGEAEEVYQAFMRLAESLGIGDLIRTLPALPYDLMPGLFAMADGLVNYPSQDAFPSTLVEAAACELPIVSAWLPGYAGTFVDTCSDLVERDSVEALADALVYLVNQPPEERVDRLNRARTEVVEQYNERLSAERLLGLYRDLANSSFPPPPTADVSKSAPPPADTTF